MEGGTSRFFSAQKLIFVVFILNLSQFGQTEDATKLRLCMVAGRDAGSQVSRLCLELGSAPGSAASCSLAPDRLTCLRRVARGTADFATLQAEDLLVASRRNSDDVAITNQLRTLAKPQFEYELAAVVRKSANISTLAQLRNSTFCHPGFGYETDWTGVVSRFLEVRVVPQRCDPSMTLAENSLNSSAEFFRSACKAGPWVPDPDLDSELKSRYPSLCKLCDAPNECSTLDKYWGRLGPLFCLTDGAGDVLWARLDHIRTHFAPEDPGASAEGLMSDFSFLCPDGSLQGLEELGDRDSQPCVWISRPWPVVVANRRVAASVQGLVRTLAQADSGSWQRALSLLVAPLQQHTPPTIPVATPEELLGTASGWLNAATVSPCGATGSPRVCVDSSAGGGKCQWLSEAARAHGVRGAPLCVRANDCVAALARGDADMTTIHPDRLYEAKRDRGLKVLLYERPDRPDDLYLVTAVVTNPEHWTLSDLRGKRACFPSFRGASWQVTVAALRSKGLVTDSCQDSESLLSFFSAVCVARGNSSEVPLCRAALQGEEGEGAESTALRCLVQGQGDVAFVDKASLEVIGGNVSWSRQLRTRGLHLVCYLNLKEGCHLGWASHGMVVVRSSESVVRLRQWRTMLERLDELFGPNHRTPTPAMLMFGPFDSQPSVLFHNTTRELVDYESLTQDTAAFSLDLVQVLREQHAHCHSGATHSRAPAVLLLLAALLLGCLLHG